MNRNIKTLILVIFYTVSFCAFADTSDVYEIEGQSSLYGNFKGQLYLQNAPEGILPVKILNYEKYTFENLKVQELWTGVAKSDNSVLSLSYSIRQADFLLTAERQKRSPEMFKNDFVITQKIDLTKNEFTIESSRGNEKITEKFVKVEKVYPGVVWSENKVVTKSFGNADSLVLKLAKFIFINDVLDWYHGDPKVKIYETHNEYKNKDQFLITDFTDLKFYEKNNDMIRVTNKVPDYISLVEEVHKRNAFTFTLDEKMLHFEEDMSKYHLNEYGLISNAKFDNENKFVEYIFDGDAALWSGMYLGAEAMRYELTKEKSALDNVKKVLNGLVLLMEITGNPSEFARTIMMRKNGVAIAEGWKVGSGKHSDKIWLTGGNNDMYKGIVHGMIWAYLVMPKTEKFYINKLKNYMYKIPDLSVANSTSNKSTAYGLRALVTKSSGDTKRFVKNFMIKDMGAVLTSTKGSVHLGGIADWSGTNLTMVGRINEVLIAKAIKRDVPSDPSWFFQDKNDVYFEARKSLLLEWKDLVDTKRDCLTVAAHTFALKNGMNIKDALSSGDGFNEETIRSKWLSSIRESKNSLIEIPKYRSQYNLKYDFSYKRDWILSWWPFLPWKSIDKRKPVDYHFQNVYSFPLYESLGISNNFIWKESPFAYQGWGMRGNRKSGADYLYLYWMSKYGKLL